MARTGDNIRRRKDGRYEARVAVGRGEDGKLVYRSLYGRSLDEVMTRRSHFLNGRDPKEFCLPVPRDEDWESLKAGFESGRLNELYEGTVSAAALEWMRSIRPEIKESTYAQYSFMLRRHIFPRIGRVKTKDLTATRVEEFKRLLLTEGCIGREKGLSPKSAACVLAVVKQVLEYAQAHGYEVQSIRIHGPRQKKPVIRVLAREEQHALEKVLASDRNRVNAGIMLSLYAGLRIGEVCALKWGDVDLKLHLLRIRRTISRIQETGAESESRTKVVLGVPKTDSSRRVIPLNEDLVRYITPYKAEDNAFFLTGTEEYMEPRSFYARYKKVMEQCGLDHYNYHALRHTFATRCIESGVDVKSLSEILGHSDVSVTLGRYVHPSLDQKRKEMDRLMRSMKTDRK